MLHPNPQDGPEKIVLVFLFFTAQFASMKRVLVGKRTLDRRNQLSCVRILLSTRPGSRGHMASIDSLDVNEPQFIHGPEPGSQFSEAGVPHLAPTSYKFF